MANKNELEKECPKRRPGHNAKFHLFSGSPSSDLENVLRPDLGLLETTQTNDVQRNLTVTSFPRKY
jgi:hypothetical protein